MSAYDHNQVLVAPVTPELLMEGYLDCCYGGNIAPEILLIGEDLVSIYKEGKAKFPKAPVFNMPNALLDIASNEVWIMNRDSDPRHSLKIRNVV